MTWWHRLWRAKEMEEQLEKELGFRSSFNFIPEGDYRVSRELREEYRLGRSGFYVHSRARNQRNRDLMDSSAHNVARRDESDRLWPVAPAGRRNPRSQRSQGVACEWFQQRVDRAVEHRDRIAHRPRDCRDRLAPTRVIAVAPERERPRQCVGDPLGTRAGTFRTLPTHRAGR